MVCQSCGSRLDYTATVCASCGTSRTPTASCDAGQRTRSGNLAIVETTSSSIESRGVAASGSSNFQSTREGGVEAPRSPHRNSAPKKIAFFAIGCLAIPPLAIVIFVGAIVIWWSLQPKDVGYDDRLDHTNVNTFVTHHLWSDSWTEEGNTAYAQHAITNLGRKAYGRTFGELMDWQKRHEADQEWQRISVRAEHSANTSARANTRGVDPSGSTSGEHDVVQFNPDGSVTTVEGETTTTTPLLIEGSTAEINAKGDDMPCFDSADSLDGFIKAAIDNDDFGKREFIAEHSTRLREGMIVRDIGTKGLLASVVDLRIESGPNAGSDCWEPTDIGYFRNIRSSGDGQ